MNSRGGRPTTVLRCSVSPTEQRNGRLTDLLRRIAPGVERRSCAQTGVARLGDRRGPVRNLELRQDGGHVVPHRLLGEDEPAGDLVVAQSAGEQFEDLPL